jgi:lipoprotein signal peptidase
MRRETSSRSWGKEMTFRLGLTVFLAALAVDLVTKAWAIDHADLVVYNPMPGQLPRRIVMSLVAIGVAVVLAQVAMRRGLGRQWGVTVGCALLVAGVLSNGVSPLLWPRGVPDFIAVGDGWIWNLADFEIGMGLTGGIVSVAVAAIGVYTREKLSSRTRG